MITIIDNTTRRKTTIRKYMAEKKFSLNTLSKEANIAILELVYLIFVPFAKLKLTQAIHISKALGIKLSNIY